MHNTIKNNTKTTKTFLIQILSVIFLSGIVKAKTVNMKAKKPNKFKFLFFNSLMLSLMNRIDLKYTHILSKDLNFILSSSH